MSYELRTIDEIPLEMLRELLVHYNQYIIDFFDDQRHLEGSVPVCVSEFYNHEFLATLEEQQSSWRLYVDTLQYSFSRKFDNRVDVIVGALVFTIEVPEEIYNSDDHVLTQHIDDEHGEMIFNIMQEMMNSSISE